jgi:hypothetical protein
VRLRGVLFLVCTFSGNLLFQLSIAIWPTHLARYGWVIKFLWVVWGIILISWIVTHEKILGARLKKWFRVEEPPKPLLEMPDQSQSLGKVQGVGVAKVPRPNLIPGSLLYRTLELNDGLWIGNRGLEQIPYRAQLLEIRDAPIPGEFVPDVGELSAQVIVLTNGSELCSGSPAAWEDESLNKVTIPLGETKNIILMVCEGTWEHHVGGYWQVISDKRDIANVPTKHVLTSIPMQYAGKLWVRLLHRGEILRTIRFTWNRKFETGAFEIRPE